MEAVISESLFEKQKSSFDMLNRNWVFILLFNKKKLHYITENKKNKGGKAITLRKGDVL